MSCKSLELLPGNLASALVGAYTMMETPRLSLASHLGIPPRTHRFCDIHILFQIQQERDNEY
jgi:hypothetical protein